MEDVKVTIQVARVLAALLDDPSAAHYGLDVMHRAGLSSGSLYPILRRLEKAGFLTSEWESIDKSAAGRPRRRYYRLTGNGAARARLELAELAELARPAPRFASGGLAPGAS